MSVQSRVEFFFLGLFVAALVCGAALMSLCTYNVAISTNHTHFYFNYTGCVRGAAMAGGIETAIGALGFIVTGVLVICTHHANSRRSVGAVSSARLYTPRMEE